MADTAATAAALVLERQIELLTALFSSANSWRALLNSAATDDSLLDLLRQELQATDSTLRSAQALTELLRGRPTRARTRLRQLILKLFSGDEIPVDCQFPLISAVTPDDARNHARGTVEMLTHLDGPLSRRLKTVEFILEAELSNSRVMPVGVALMTLSGTLIPALEHALSGAAADRKLAREAFGILCEVQCRPLRVEPRESAHENAVLELLLHFLTALDLTSDFRSTEKIQQVFYSSPLQRERLTHAQPLDEPFEVTLAWSLSNRYALNVPLYEYSHGSLQTAELDRLTWLAEVNSWDNRFQLQEAWHRRNESVRYGNTLPRSAESLSQALMCWPHEKLTTALLASLHLAEIAGDPLASPAMMKFAETRPQLLQAIQASITSRTASPAEQPHQLNSLTDVPGVRA